MCCPVQSPLFIHRYVRTYVEVSHNIVGAIVRVNYRHTNMHVHTCTHKNIRTDTGTGTYIFVYKMYASVV